MKKTLLSITLAAATLVPAYGQGTVAVYSISSTYSNDLGPNWATYSPSVNGVYISIASGAVAQATAANSYYYALLVQPYNASITAIDPLDPNYTVGMMATNFVLLSGSIFGSRGAAGAPVTPWGAPTGATYDTGSLDNFLLVGWSSNLGSTWAELAPQLSSGNWLNDGYFGVSTLGYGYSGGGPNSLPASSIFGATAAMPGGLSTGITLYAVVPEPAAFAVAALGGLAFLAFRRRK